MKTDKSHANAVPFAIRVIGKGFALSIRQFLDAQTARRQRRRAQRELEALPPELQRDVGWEGRFLHDKR
ncbi:hypothetical protein [Mycoplana rhizolycopersici]|uniref:DUF1127 domain-containing protein n=1 Tax=Mycoplana rhizolycopersici TaxID=2746702 RepID=A0ABX2QII9_9HYPH|nr:hypothetical protein [Rhizobium rhizolycopersici]NVP57161.1 hypothetical protein [Rhizobium rhizolycopersici]